MDINQLLSEYREEKKKLDFMFDDMNNYMQPLSEIHRKQQLFLDFENHLKEELYGKFIEFTSIDRKGNEEVKSKKVETGKYESIVDLLSKRELV